MTEHLFQKSRCQRHRLRIEYVCFLSTCHRQSSICSKCLPAHENHLDVVYSLDSFKRKIQVNIKLTGIKVDKAKKLKTEIRQEVSEIIAEIDGRYARAEANIRKIVTEEQQDQLQVCSQATEIFHKLNDANKIISYFKTLRDQNLLLLKLKCSSKKGLEKFQDRKAWFNGYTEEVEKENLRKAAIEYEQKKRSIAIFSRNNVCPKLFEHFSTRNPSELIERKTPERKTPESRIRINVQTGFDMEEGANRLRNPRKIVILEV